jgi:predicted RNA-binding Zn ribbon-like protein
LTGTRWNGRACAGRWGFRQRHLKDSTGCAAKLNAAGHGITGAAVRRERTRSPPRTAGDLEQVLLTIALSAHRLLTESTRERLQQCDNERCMMLFYDNTRSGTQRWCSTACMDRMRSAERYKLVRQSRTP